MNSFPHGASCSPARRRGSVLVLALVALAILTVLGGGAVYYLTRGSSDKEEKPLTAVAEIKPFEFVVVEQGEVESSENVEVKCEVKGFNGSTALLWVIPEGTQVKEGDLLVTLDASSLEQQKLQQEVLTNTAKALVVQSQNLYEAALIAREEYLEGIFKQEEQLIQSEIFQAEENLRRAQIAGRTGAKLADRGLATPQQMEAEKFAVEKARLELDSAQTRLRGLQEYTKTKMLKTLESDIATQKAKWDSDLKSYEIEQQKLKDILDQIAKCEIRSPRDGQVVYANVVSSRGNSEFIVEPGAMVREQQAIIRLPNPNKMQVKAKINESQITSIRPGMPAKVNIDAFDSEEPLSGVVSKVNEYPEASSWFSSPIKQYLTYIQITNPPKDIRPGLTAEVSIQVEKRPEALLAPVQTIYDHFGTTYCLVYEDGKFEAREIEIGSANDKFIVIESGLEAKQNIVMNPRRWLTKVTLPEPPEPVIGPDEQLATGETAADGAPELTGDGVPGAPNGFPGGSDGPGGPGGPGGGRGPGGSGGGFNPAQIVARAFTENDKNGDGNLSADEIPADRAARWQGADANNDGIVSRVELTTFLNQRLAAGVPGGPGGAGGPGGGFAPAGGPGAPGGAALPRGE
jgi:multidrug efflux pump subunit AcrA (membrane-fusion protein)